MKCDLKNFFMTIDKRVLGKILDKEIPKG